MEDLASNVLINVPHMRQETSWDCGLASTKMVLRFLNIEYDGEEDNFDQICQELGIRTGAWTIDLAYIVNKYKIKHYFCTQTLGVDPSYQNVGFYTEVMSFSSEEKRVNDLFSCAEKENVQVQKRGVSKEEILKHLATGNPIIMLIDASILRCTQCYYLPPLCMGNGCLAVCCNTRNSYQGHFIVLCGYDMSTEQYHYKNPSNMQELCSCTFTNLEEARKSHGTDEDILYIYR
ncbi:protein GUCD1-like [Amphiura filiformis]|uniref:protein GUCD1-like n=1 Tax=Amphiura filiformis TaxID=82378 RepID=UPI003B21FF75